MLQDIEIENFRCFDDLKVSGFSRVNLISGQNNSGKTTLLESIFVGSMSKIDDIFGLEKIRKKSLFDTRKSNREIFENLFFDRDYQLKISINCRFETRDLKSTILFNEENIFDFLEYQQYYLKLNESRSPVMLIHQDLDLASNISSHRISFLGKANKSFVSLESAELEVDHTEIDYADDKIDSKREDLEIVFDPKNFKQRNIDLDEIIAKDSSLVSLFSRRSHEELARFYDVLRLADQEEKLINAFQEIDPSIINLETFVVGEPMIYVKQKSTPKLPLSVFGDAMQRIAEIIFCLLSQPSADKNKFLIIDEIENGLHYTHHQAFWEMLWKLARELDVQIFATTHSREMIESFVQVSEAKGFDDGAYFEMARHAKTGKIIVIRRDLDTLMYGLNEGGVRGE